jgi:cytochrome c-type biogenesis protein CcmF
MTAALGSAGVLLGFLAAASGVAALAAGLVGRREDLLRKAPVFAVLVLAGALTAAVAMEIALIGHDFSLRFVAENGSRSTPLLYTFASLWGALEGSIILWSLVLSGYLLLMVHRFRDRLTDPLVGWAVLTVLVVATFFFGLMMGPAAPFRHVAGATPLDGPGPNPLLQNHPLMAFHPPLLYLGYVGFTIPFAFAIGALVTGRVGESWLSEIRHWVLLAWGCLGVGIVLGAWWSYEVLGWGGFWAWDPVENASFLPWLCATAYLHSAMVQQRRAMLRVWNIGLLVATFSLTILGTFLTRSGVLDSVHAFTESLIGPMILGFFALIVAVSVALIAWRGDQLRSPGSIRSAVSREASFLVNNLVFAAFAFVVLLGTLFPQLIEAINGDRITVGRPYFDRMAIPIGMSLLLLMAIAPALPWQRASAEVVRRRLVGPAWVGAGVMGVAVLLGAHGTTALAAFGLAGFAAAVALRQIGRSLRRHGWRGLLGGSSGGMVVHVGVVLIAVALTASGSYEHSGEFQLKPGESASLGGHEITYLGAGVKDTAEKRIVTAQVRVDGGQVYAPAVNQFPSGARAIGTPSVRTTLRDDVYLTLVDPPSGADGPATIGLIVQPLVVFLWIGGALIGLGAILAALPSPARRELGSDRRRRIRARDEQAEREVVGVGA